MRVKSLSFFMGIGVIATAVAGADPVTVDADPTYPSGGSGYEVPIQQPRQLVVDMAVPDVVPALRSSTGVETPGASSTPVAALGFEGQGQLPGTPFLVKPPDTHIAAGTGAGAAGRIVEVTNNGVTIFDKTGSLVAGPTGLDTFVSTVTAKGGFDPKVLFDQHSGRFFICVIDGAVPNSGGSGGENLVHVAVSTSSTPGNTTVGGGGDWDKYSASTLTDFVGNGSGPGPGGVYETWFDYPGIGADATRLVITGNMFDGSGNYRGVKVRVFDKAALIAGSNSFTDIDVDDFAVAVSTTMPAHTYGSTDSGNFYLINRIGSTTYRLWEIGGTPASPVLVAGTYNTSRSWAAGSYISAGAPQQTTFTSITLDTLVTRMMDAVYRDGSLWCCLSADADGDSKTEVVWFEINTNGGNPSAPSIAQSGFINGSDGDEWTFLPSIAVNADDAAAICYTQSHTDQFADMRVVTRESGDAAGTFTASEVYRTSVGEYDDFGGLRPNGADRWGDYSAAVVDPDDDRTFWVANEYVASAVTAALNDAAWGTFIGKVGALSVAVNPEVNSVTRADSDPSNASSVDFTVTFGEPVTGVDTGDFSLTTTGVTGSSVTGVSGSGATYTVSVNTGSGDGTIRLDVSDDDSITAISDGDPLGGVGAGNGDFTSGQIYTIDKTAPTGALGLPMPTSTTTDPVEIDVSYFNADAVTLDMADITLNTTSGDAMGTASVSGSGVSARVVTISSFTGEGTMTMSIASGTASDTAGNLVAAIGPSASFSVDTVPPTLTLSEPSATVSSTGPVYFTAIYSGADSISLVTGDVTLNSPGGATGTVSILGSGTETRTVMIDGISGSGTLGITVAAGTASDTAGNSALGAGPSMTFDASPNTVLTYVNSSVSLAIADGSFTQTTIDVPVGGVEVMSDVNVVLDIDHPNVADLDIALRSPQGTQIELFTDVGGAGNHFRNTTLDDEAGTAITAGSAPFAGRFQPEGVLSGFDGQTSVGTWTLLMTDDSSGNAGTLNRWSLDLQGDTPPSVLSITRANGNPINAASVDFTVTFSESVTGVGTADFDLSTSGVSGANITGVAGVGVIRTVTVNTGSGNGTIRLDVDDDDSIQDGGGFPLGGSGIGNGDFFAGETYTIDKTGPVVSIGAPMPSSIYSGSASFVVTYSGADFVTLAPGDVNVNTLGTVAATVGVSGSGTSQRTVTLSGVTGSGFVIIDIAANTASDSGGNFATAVGPSAELRVSPYGSTLNRGSDFPKAIADDGTITSTITIPSGGAVIDITDVEVTVDIAHTRVADLDVFLMSPTGTTVELFTDVGGNGDDFTNTTLDDEAGTAITSGAAPFTGVFRPEGALSDYVGETSVGTWTLTITDDTAGQAGTLNVWLMTITGNNLLPGLPAGGVIGLAALASLIACGAAYRVRRNRRS
jgi:subtilisin-like proprotein convertase family protein